MLFTSPLQLLVLCAVAVVAWLLGFATNPAGANTGDAMRKLSREFATFRSNAHSRLNTLARHAATLEATHQAMVDRLAEAEARIAAFKGNGPRQDMPVAGTVQAPTEDDSLDPIVPPLTPGETAAPPPYAEALPDLAEDDMPMSSAFGGTDTPAAPRPIGGTPRDVLTRIDGIDQALELRLGELGIRRFADIEKLSDQDEMALELRLALPAGYITGRQWRQQATALHASDLADLANRFGPSRSGDA